VPVNEDGSVGFLVPSGRMLYFQLLDEHHRALQRSRPQTPLFLIPNFHDASMGWLVSYAEERNFGLYSYLAHLDRVTADPQYKFVMSEIPRLITMMDFEPKRVEELRKRIAEGRVELVNAFVLEPTVSLSGFSVAGGNHIQQVRLASLLGQCT
jgi:hypothetical protein